MARRVIALLVLALTSSLAGCADECATLAERICGCEETFALQQSCELQVQAQQDADEEPSDAQRQVCASALETCTCDALAQNRTDLCGFTREPGEAG
jgi:hypothetical protein